MKIALALWFGLGCMFIGWVAAWYQYGGSHITFANNGWIAAPALLAIAASIVTVASVLDL